jgi:RNA polymerase sigma-70 factor, ECF subfamily
MSTVQAAGGQTEGEPRDWLHELRRRDRTGEEAVERLYTLLLGATRFMVARRDAKLPLTPEEAAAIAVEAADDAVLQVRAHLGDFGGDRRFTTWARKFAIHEAAVRLRRTT